MMVFTAGGSAFGQSATDGLFFAHSGADKLPVMLIIAGGLLFVTSIIVTALLGLLSRRRLFLTIPLISAATLLIERALVATVPSWIYPVLWLTAAVVVLLQWLFTWGLLGHRRGYPPGEATVPAVRRRCHPRRGDRRPLDEAARRPRRSREPPLRVGGVLGRRVTGRSSAGRKRVRPPSWFASDPDQPKVRPFDEMQQGAPVRSRLHGHEVDVARGDPVLRPVLLPLPAVLPRGDRSLPLGGRTRRVLRPVLGGHDRGRAHHILVPHQSDDHAVRCDHDVARPGAHLPRGVRCPHRERDVRHARRGPVRADAVEPGGRQSGVGGRHQHRARPPDAIRPAPSSTADRPSSGR